MLLHDRVTTHMETLIQYAFKDPNPGAQGYGMIAERGGIASRVAGTGPTTSSPDDVGNRVEYAVDPTSAEPIGMNIQDVIKFDSNRQHDNWMKQGFQVRVEQKVDLDPKGQYWTNFIDPAITAVSPGQPAYLAANGMISNVQATSGSGSTLRSAPQVGRFKSFFDPNRFAQVKLTIS